MSTYDYDLFVIGGGSGGVRAGRVTASLGKRVAIAEQYRVGGTCVIRGCVPKKLFVHASQFRAQFRDAAAFGWKVSEPNFDWQALIAAKDKAIARLERLYRQGLENAGATILDSRAELVDAHTIRLMKTGETLTDIFHGLGVAVTLMCRSREILARFDQDMRSGLHEAMVEKGIRIMLTDVVESDRKSQHGGLTASTMRRETLTVDTVMLALGRAPNTQGLGLVTAGVATTAQGSVVVDKYSRTSVPNIYALGDVTDRVQLTPVAIHEANCFVETVYRGNPTSPDHEVIPTAVFSQPEIGSVGLTEAQAGEQYAAVDVYRAAFRPMRATLSGHADKTIMKLLVDATSRKVIGAHVLGHEAGEMAQLLGIPLKAGLTKEDFDRTMAIHPTAAEELVTMYVPSYMIRHGRRVPVDTA